VWFARGGTFNDWIAKGGLLWIHGKRVCFQTFYSRGLTAAYHCSGIWEKCPVVGATSIYLVGFFLTQFIKQFHHC